MVKKRQWLGLTTDMPGTFDFKSLDNYVPPERTRRAENERYESSVTYFLKVGEYFVTADSCQPEADTDLEFERTQCMLSDDQHDAMYSLYVSSLGDKRDMRIIKEMNLTAVFKRNSLICRRGEWRLAFVKNNKLYLA